jgi:hypothetical protein
VATRSAQETRAVTIAQALAFVAEHGIVCEAAGHARVPSLVSAITGDPMSGNWWSHPRSREIFAITRAVRDSTQILVCRVVQGKISFVHRRVWPALVRAENHFPRRNLARVREVHSESGKHVLEEMPFPAWVPKATSAAAKRISEADALKALRPLTNG